MMKRFTHGNRGVAAGTLLAAGLAIGSCGGPGANVGPPAVASPDAHLPPGYALRLDRPNRDDTEFVATSRDDGLEVQTGPAGIVYRPDQVVDAEQYAVHARLTEINAPVGHLEGFGLFIGGQDLQGAGQRYIYFLIRGDGRYLIKRRDGANTPEISNGWQPSKAVRFATHQDGDMTNELAIAVDRGRLRFSCNGEQVADMPVGDLSVRGVAGVRVNHNLVVRIQDFRVER
ncbi:MAG: hypothetical protein WBD07_14995 [Vicinamibacterales bacterium]